MTLKGLLVEVVEDTRGSQATALVAPTDADGNEVASPQIPVEDLTDFPDLGGIIEILGEQYPYSWILPDPETIDPDTLVPTTSGQIVLDEPLRAQVDEDDPVHLVLNGEVATDAYAVVDFPAPDDADAPDDVAPVRVPIDYSQRPMYPVGPYEPAVPIEVADDLSRVITVPGVKPTIDATNVINLPTDSNEPTEPPALSPAIEVHGTVDSLVVEVIEEYAASTTIDFHISTTPDFTPSDATLVGSSRSAVFVITALPPAASSTASGTASATADAAPADSSSQSLALNTTYYVRTVARNIIGAAAPGPVTSGTLDPSKVSELVAARLVAGFILTGAMQVGNITIDPTSGIVIPQSDGGIIQLPADGSVATIAAHVNARSLHVDDDWAMAGYGELGGEMQITSGVNNPTAAPTITADIPWIDLQDPDQELGNLFYTFCVTSETRLLGVTAGGTLGVWDITTGQRVGTSTISGFSGRTLKGVAVQPRDGYLYALSWTSADSTYRLHRIDLNTVSVVATKTVAVWDTNALKNAKMVLPDYGNCAAILFDRYSSGTRAGISVRFFDTSKSAMPQVGGDVVLTSTGTLSLEEAAIGYGQDPDWPETLLVHRSDDSIPAWTYQERNDGTAPTLVRASSLDLTKPTADTFAVGSTSSSGTNGYDVYALGPGGTATTSRLYRMRRLGNLVFNAAYTWYDGDATGGTHESAASPVKSLTLPGGRFPTISMPTPPEASITDPGRTDKANRLGFYASTGSGAQVYRQSYLPVGSIGVKAGALNLDHLAVIDKPPATNGFIGTASAPGRIRSAAVDASQKPYIDLYGDGSWRLGNLSGDPNGTVKYASDTGWINIPLASGYAASGAAPQYRIKSGVVYIVGNITQTGGTLAINTSPGHTIGTLPASATPAAQQVALVPPQNPAIAQARMFVLTTGEVKVYLSSSAVPYVTLNMAYPL